MQTTAMPKRKVNLKIVLVWCICVSAKIKNNIIARASSTHTEKFENSKPKTKLKQRPKNPNQTKEKTLCFLNHMLFFTKIFYVTDFIRPEVKFIRKTVNDSSTYKHWTLFLFLLFNFICFFVLSKRFFFFREIKGSK